ncbi:MAG: flagellar basal body L-ring protein FlgH [Planctomycetota bacterium]|nr:MAG: flagellar basal body L-ring protein FlgH [Planctomycetota bacterium]
MNMIVDGAQDRHTTRAPCGARGAVVAMIVLAGLAGDADAQINSLRKRGLSGAKRPAPTTQPAQRPNNALFGDASQPPARTVVATEPPRVRPNPALYAASLIAVDAPEKRRIRVHDLVTIIIREDKRSQTDANLKSEKTWQIDAELRKWFRLDVQDRLVPQTFPNGTPGIGFDLDNAYEGKGKNDRKDSLTLRITAQVIDVKPNGVLELEAVKTIKVDEDVQVITLTGACRSDDISADNTILSTQIASASISVQHTGPARDAARRGWLMRAFDLLRPF